MIVDIILACIVFVFAVYGYRTGFVKQAFALLGIVCVYLLAPSMAEVLAHILRDEFNLVLPKRYEFVVFVSTCGAILYLLCSVIGAFLHKTLISGIKIVEKTDRLVGIVLGAIQSALILLFLLTLAISIEDRISKYTPKIQTAFDASQVYQFSKEEKFYELVPFDLGPAPGKDSPENSEEPKGKDAETKDKAIPLPANPKGIAAEIVKRKLERSVPAEEAKEKAPEIENKDTKTNDEPPTPTEAPKRVVS